MFLSAVLLIHGPSSKICKNVATEPPEFTAADPDGNLFGVFYDFATPERAKHA